MSKRKGLVTAKQSEAGFTLVELLVVIAIIALLMGILLPALARARELGKRAVCMNQLKQMHIAWGLYCDSNNDKIPIGDVGYSWTFCKPGDPGCIGSSPTPPGHQLAWVEYPHQLHPGLPPSENNWNNRVADPVSAKDEIWWHAIEEGTMWKYVKDHKVYKCPVGDKGYRETIYMSHSMATYPNSGGTNAAPAPQIALRSRIKRTAEQFVFLDVGSMKGGAFFIPYSSGVTTPGLVWGDTPPVRHGLGTNFIFVDGHIEYRKWVDPHTIEATKHDWGGRNWGANAVDNTDCDLRWIGHATWGSLFFANTSTTKRCDY